MRNLKSCGEIDREMKDREIGFYSMCRYPEKLETVICSTMPRFDLITPPRKYAKELNPRTLAKLLKDCDWAWEETKPKEVLGVDYVYGLGVEKTKTFSGCKLCVLSTEECAASGIKGCPPDEILVLTKLPRKKPKAEKLNSLQEKLSSLQAELQDLREELGQ